MGCLLFETNINLHLNKILSVLIRNILSFILLAFLLSFAGAARGQAVFLLDSLPAKTPATDTVFMATSLNGWNPHDDGYAFNRDSSGLLSLRISSPADTFEYKLCRGSWKTVEVAADGRDIPNRLYTTCDTVKLSVGGWRDMLAKGQAVSTASKNVRYLPTSMRMPQLNRNRTIRLYLPPNYAGGGPFPVIYMHDGQNLFDDATSFAGEWHVDEILDSLYTYRGFSAIVVAIYNDDSERLNEYSPWRNDSLDAGGNGDKYVRFIVETLKPFIDKHYRTDPRSQSTAIIGSSMGGLITLYAALEYPNVFGKAAVFSPSLWFSPKVYEYIQKYRHKGDQRLYMLAGEKESGSLVADVTRAADMLRTAGFTSDSYLMIKIVPNGRHTEEFWSREFGEAIRYLYEF